MRSLITDKHIQMWNFHENFYYFMSSFPDHMTCVHALPHSTRNCSGTNESNTDVELPLKPLLFHVLISRPYDVCPRAAPQHTQIALESVMRNFNKKIDRKNINFSNKTAI